MRSVRLIESFTQSLCSKGRGDVSRSDGQWNVRWVDRTVGWSVRLKVKHLVDRMVRQSDGRRTLNRTVGQLDQNIADKVSPPPEPRSEGGTCSGALRLLFWRRPFWVFVWMLWFWRRAPYFLILEN